MIALIPPHAITTRSLDSKRIRTVESWAIHDWGGGEYSITGVVTEDSEVDKPENAFRITRTSPIQHRLGSNILVTKSGSEYTLGTPHDASDQQRVCILFEDKA